MTSDITNPGTRFLGPDAPPMPSHGLFKWGPVDCLFQSLAACIYPQRRRRAKKQEACLSEEEEEVEVDQVTATMVKKLVLSTG